MMPRLLIALLLSMPMWLLADDPPNLVRNPGFEELTADGFASDWRGGEFGKPGANVTIQEGSAHTGSKSARLGISPNSFVTCAAASIPVKPGTTYYVTWWCRTENLDQARAYLFLQTNKGQRVFEGGDETGSRDWTQHFGEYTTTEDETALHPVLTTQDLGGGPCHALFDDIGIYEDAFPLELAATWTALKRAREGISDTAVVLARDPELTLWADRLEARIYQADGVPEYAQPAQEFPLAAARGETDYLQLVVQPASDLQQVELVGSDLTGPATIPSSSVHWWPVGQANIKTAHRSRTRLGLTPDPLLNPGPVSAPAGSNAVFCVGVSAPRDAQAGTYRGTVTVRSAGKPLVRAPISLRVFDFTLPRDPTFRTLITFSPSSFAPWDKRATAEIEKDICRVLFEHGVRGHGATVAADARIEDGKVVCDFRSMDARIAWVMENLRFNAFFLGPMFGGGTSEGWQAHRKWLGLEPLSDEFNRLFPDYMRQVGRHLREKGWLENAYLYLWDEPEADYFDKVVALQRLALKGDPGFKIWETTSPSHEAFWDVVKAWSVPFSRPHFSEKAVEARRRAGDEIWVYNIPATLEAPPQIHRLWFWQAARYGAVGAQLWQTTFYHNIDPWEEITPKPYPVGRDRSSLYYYDAGQAILLYPDPKGGGGRPLASLRLKLIKKGIDDFEYLQILRRALQQRERAAGAADPTAAADARIRELSGVLVKDIGSYELGTSALQQARIRIAEEIQAALQAQ